MKDIGNGLIKLEHGDLEKLGKMAVETKKSFDDLIKKLMTKERAERIRSLRIGDCICSWRRIAEICYEEWGSDADWQPCSNQLAGMALCEFAAKIFNENYMEEPWN